MVPFLRPHISIFNWRADGKYVLAVLLDISHTGLQQLVSASRGFPATFRRYSTTLLFSGLVYDKTEELHLITETQ
jgi:hypothetical protein